MRRVRLPLVPLLVCVVAAALLATPPADVTAQPQPAVDGRFTETFNGDVGRRAAEGAHPFSGRLRWTAPVEGVEAGPSCVGCPTGPQQHGGIVFDRAGHLLVPTLTESGLDRITAVNLTDGAIAWTSSTAGSGGVRPGCLAVDEDGLIWTLTTEDGYALLPLDPASGQEVPGRRIEVDSGFFLSCRSGLHLLPGGRAAAFDGTYHTLHVFDLETGTEVWQTTPAPGTFRGGDLLLTSRDGQRLYVLVPDDGTGDGLRLRSHDVATGAPVGEVTVPGFAARVFPMATALVDVDGSILLTTGDAYGDSGDGHIVRVADDGGTLAVDWHVPAAYNDPDDAWGGVPTQLLPGGTDGRTVVAIDSWGDQLVGLDLADGSTRWTTPFPRAADPLGFEAMTDADGNILLPWAVAGITETYPPWDTFSPDGVHLDSGPLTFFEGLAAFGPLGPDGTLYGNAVLGGSYLTFAVAAGQPGQGGLSVSPTTVGDGFATVQIRGGDAESVSGARLSRDGEVREGEVFPGGQAGEARVTFDLRDAAHGEWALTADAPGGPVSLGTIVVELASPEKALTVATFVRDAIRSGVTTSLAVHVRNDGNVDLNAVPVAIALEGVPPDTELTAVGLGDPPPIGADAPAGFSWAQHPFTTSDEGRVLVPLLMPVLGPKDTTTVQLHMTIPAGEGTLESGRLVATVGECWATNDRQPADFLVDASGAASTAAFADTAAGECVTDLLTTGFTGIVGPALGPLGSCVLGAMVATPSVVANVRDERWIPVAWAVAQSTLSCAAVFYPQLAVPARTNLAISLVASALMNCGDVIGYKDFTWGGSADPNDIIGPSGTGAERWLSTLAPLDYTVRFENRAEAAFPAATVVVTTTIDPNLDPASLTLGPVGWGAHTFAPPAGTIEWNEPFLVDGLLVEIDVDRDDTTLTWTLRSLDPATGLPPEDPAAGFLPPNATPPDGEGYVSFTVRPYPTLADGTTVEADASITFDVNPAIATNVWANTFDRTPPMATATPAADPSPSNAVTFSLGGSDNLSGVMAWQLAAGVGLEAPERIDARRTDEDVAVIAPRGGRVRLEVQAIDGAGNLQPSPISAAASVADDAVQRFAGPGRIDTAVAVSRATFGRAGAVVLARADTYPDALAGAPLAHALGGPILLTDSAALTSVTAAEIRRLGAAEAWVLGGEAAISTAVIAELEALDLAVTRVAGASRFATAAAVAAQLGAPERVFVAEGANADPARGWPDALAVAPLAARLSAPTLLTTRDDLPAETLEALRQLGPQRITIVGGTAAVGEEVAAAIAAEGFAVDRIAGADRYGTGLALLDEAVAEAVADPLVTWLATGLAFPDALAAGPAVAATGGQLLLVHGEVPAASAAVFDRLADVGGEIGYARLIGGTAAVSTTTERAVRDVLRAAPYG